MFLLPCSLKLRQESWEAKLYSLPCIETVMANCILAAAFTTCCGPLKTGSRLRVFNSLLAICKNCGFPPAGSEDRESLLTLEQYPKFMIGEVTIMKQFAVCTCTGYCDATRACMYMVCIILAEANSQCLVYWSAFCLLSIYFPLKRHRNSVLYFVMEIYLLSYGCSSYSTLIFSACSVSVTN